MLALEFKNCAIGGTTALHSVAVAGVNSPFLLHVQCGFHAVGLCIH